MLISAPGAPDVDPGLLHAVRSAIAGRSSYSDFNRARNVPAIAADLSSEIKPVR
jgi:hypothetical protein